MTQPTTDNLAVERAEITTQLNAPPEPSSNAKRIVDEADAEIAAHEQRIAELKARRDKINSTFRVKQAEEAQARVQAAAEERAALDSELREASEAMFASVASAQHHFEAAVGAVNAAIKANVRVREIGQRIMPATRLPIGVGLTDMVFRFGGRISAVLRTIKVPGTLGTKRLGPLDLPEGGEFLSPKGDMASSYDWRQREERAQSPAIAELLQHGRH